MFPGDWSEPELATFRILTFVLTSKFILAVLENQAYDSVAVVFILLGLLALLNDRWLLGAASLATAAALKVTPLIFLPYLIFKRRFAAAGVFMAVFVALSLLPDLLTPSTGQLYATVWVRDVLMSSFFFDPASNNMRFWVTDSPMNQTFRAAIVRYFTGVHQQQSFDTVLGIMQSRPFKIALDSVMAVYIAIVGLVMLKSRRDDRLIAVDGALLVVSALLLTPVSSQSHFLALLLPYALIAAAMVKDPPMRMFYARHAGFELRAGDRDLERSGRPQLHRLGAVDEPAGLRHAGANRAARCVDLAGARAGCRGLAFRFDYQTAGKRNRPCCLPRPGRALKSLAAAMARHDAAFVTIAE